MMTPTYKLCDLLLKVYEYISSHKKHITYVSLISFAQIALVLWYLNFKKPVNSLESVQKGIDKITEGQKKLVDGQNNLANLILINTEKIVQLKKNDSIQSDQLNHYPSTLPLAMADLTRASSEYTERIDPITGEKRFHWGIDYPAKIGTPVYATASGKIERAESDGEYGKMIRINHLNGYESLYAHLSAIDVTIGENINRGDLIGNVGKTGRATGPHLHYEITYMDKHVNPNIFRAPLKSVSDQQVSGLLNYRNFITSLEN